MTNAQSKLINTDREFHIPLYKQIAQHKRVKGRNWIDFSLSDNEIRKDGHNRMWGETVIVDGKIIQPSLAFNVGQ